MKRAFLARSFLFFNAQKASKTFKTIHVTTVVQPKYYKATRILFLPTPPPHPHLPKQRFYSTISSDGRSQNTASWSLEALRIFCFKSFAQNVYQTAKVTRTIEISKHLWRNEASFTEIMWLWQFDMLWFELKD